MFMFCTREKIGSRKRGAAFTFDPHVLACTIMHFWTFYLEVDLSRWLLYNCCIVLMVLKVLSAGVDANKSTEQAH